MSYESYISYKGYMGYMGSRGTVAAMTEHPCNSCDDVTLELRIA